MAESTGITKVFTRIALTEVEVDASAERVPSLYETEVQTLY